ncbi:MAG: flavin reductase family protein [Halanaerobiales bacterium]
MKKNIGVVNGLFPIPDVIVGTEVKGKENFVNVAYVGIVDKDIITISLSKNKYSARGIVENRSFSVNMINQGMLEKADYVGIVSGEKVDKSQVFKVFRGELEAAPMIEESLVTMECELIDTKEMETHITYFGKIINTYCSEEILNTDDKIDYEKTSHVLYADRQYWLTGEVVANAWDVGKNYNKG